MSKKQDADGRYDRDKGYDPFEISENDDNRDIISENEVMKKKKKNPIKIMMGRSN